MAITLPALSPYADCSPRLVRAGGEQSSSVGGATTTLNRLGDRWAVDVKLPPMDRDAGRIWIARRAKAAMLGQTLILTWPQASLPAVGVPTVYVGGQTGSTLVVTGGAAGLTIPEGGFFSTTNGARYSLFCVTAAVTLTGGVVGLPIAPLLRSPPALAANCYFNGAIIEGKIAGNVEWDLDLLEHVGMSFTLIEDK